MVLHYFRFWKLFGFLIFITAASSCNSTKYLEDGELLVAKNTIKIESDLSTAESSNLGYELSKVVKQKPNKENVLKRKTRMKYYFRVQKNLAKKDFRDTTKLQKWLLEKYVEKPVLYDRSLMESSTETMTFYLNNKGFFYANVTADTIVHKKKPTVEVIYTATIGNLLTINKAKFQTKDDSLHSILPIISKRTLLKKGTPVSKTIFNNEKNRITELLQDMGFTYFYPNYIFFEGDTTEARLQADITIKIAPPSDSTFHQRYKIGRVFIYTQYDPVYFRPGVELDTLTVKEYEGFYLLKSKEYEEYLIKPKPILNAFEFKKGDWYSANAYNQTRKQLSLIDIYRFVRVRPAPNPENPNEIDFYVYMNPAKKMVMGTNLELNSITSSGNSSDNVNNLGIFANVNYKHRNLLRGGEVFTASTTSGVELNLTGSSIFNAIDIQTKADLAFPIIKSERFIDKSQIHLTLAYNYVSRFLQYKQNLFTLSGGYDWRFPTKSYGATAFTSLLLPNVEDVYQIDVLDNNPLLASFFEKQLIFGSNYNYNYNSKINRAKESWRFQGSAEIAGTIINGLDYLIDPSSNFEFFNTITYSQYTRLELDGSYTKRFSEKTAFACRLNFGIGIPYLNSESLPYAKQFASGGASSIRAWQIRDVGPGAYLQLSPYKPVTTPFQTGNIKIEFNGEYRFPISNYYGFDGAVFIDGGNVWLLEDPENLNRAFKFDSFLNQIALGTGLGIRKDFGLFMFRWDMGLKVMTPYETELNAYNNRFFPRQWWRTPNHVIALDYPF